jgi:hypothetical protein
VSAIASNRTRNNCTAAIFLARMAEDDFLPSGAVTEMIDSLIREKESTER